jgi:hypothetical protein
VVCRCRCRTAIAVVRKNAEVLACRVPLYDELKLLFLLWAVAPQFKARAARAVRACACALTGRAALQGATHLYEKYVHPVLSQYDLQASTSVRMPSADVTPALDKASAFLRSVAADKRA